MNQKVMQRLVWKDARTLAPLNIAIFAAIFGLNLLCFLILSGPDLHTGETRLQISLMIWILLPNLLAFGAAAILVGGEEESGSLAWLRTLPASWRGISISKLLVTSGSLAAAWILATLLYWLQWTGSSDALVRWIEVSHQQPDWSAQAVLTHLAFSIALMLTSFVMAYWFRSPINALLAVLPVMFLIAVAFVTIETQLLNTGDRTTRLFAIPTTQLWLLYLPSIGISLVLLFGLHQWIARRRLSGPETSIRQKIERSVSSEAFRPPNSAANSPAMTWYGASLIHRRPSKTRALLWQAANQSGMALVMLTMMAVFGVTFATWASREFMALGGLAAGASLFCIVGFTFYGDSVRRRSVFLSDRGISPTLIWRTRLLPTAFAVGMVVAVMFLNAFAWNSIHNYYWWGGQHSFVYLTLIVVGYSLCQLISQWAPRPVLAFLAAPVFFAIGFAVLFPLFDFYRDGALLATWVITPILLFASWKLTPRWVAASMGRGYNLRFAGSLAAAIALPYIMVLAIRIGTIPAEQTAWRAQMMAIELPERPDDDPMIEIHSRAMPTDSIMYNPWLLAQRLSESSGRFEQQYAAEMKSETSVGGYVTMDEVLARVKSWPDWNDWLDNSELTRKQVALGIDARQEELRMAKLLLKWSAKVRHEASFEHASFTVLTKVAEQGEQIVAGILDERVKEDGMTPAIRDLIAEFPDDELVLKSRRNSLITAWQNAELQGGQSQHFPGVPRMRQTFVISKLEAFRRERFIDQSVKLAEEHWQAGKIQGVRHIPGFNYAAAEAELFQSFGALINNDTREQIQRLKTLAAQTAVVQKDPQPRATQPQ